VSAGTINFLKGASGNSLERQPYQKMTIFLSKRR